MHVPNDCSYRSSMWHVRKNDLKHNKTVMVYKLQPYRFSFTKYCAVTVWNKWPNFKCLASHAEPRQTGQSVSNNMEKLYVLLDQETTSVGVTKFSWILCSFSYRQEMCHTLIIIHLAAKINPPTVLILVFPPHTQWQPPLSIPYSMLLLKQVPNGLHNPHFSSFVFS